jgi:hypothetical protein
LFLYLHYIKSYYSCRIEDELLQDIREEAGEQNGKDVSPVPSVSASETKVNY